MSLNAPAEVMHNPELAEMIFLSLDAAKHHKTIVFMMHVDNTLRAIALGSPELRRRLMLNVKEKVAAEFLAPPSLGKALPVCNFFSDEFKALQARLKLNPIFIAGPKPARRVIAGGPRMSQLHQPKRKWHYPLNILGSQVEIEELRQRPRLNVKLTLGVPIAHKSWLKPGDLHPLRIEDLDTVTSFTKPLLYSSYISDPSLPIAFTVTWIVEKSPRTTKEPATHPGIKFKDDKPIWMYEDRTKKTARFKIVAKDAEATYARIKADVKLRGGAKFEDLERVACALVHLIPTESVFCKNGGSLNFDVDIDMGDGEQGMASALGPHYGLGELYEVGSLNWRAEYIVEEDRGRGEVYRW